MGGFKINIPNTICIIIIFLQLLWMQTDRLVGGIGNDLYQIIYYMKFLGAFFLFMYTVLFKKKDDKRIFEIKKYLNIFSPIFLIYGLVEFFALIYSPIVEEYGVRYWTRTLSMILTKICIFIEIFSLYILRDKNLFKTLCDVLIIDGVLLCINAILKYGLKDFFTTIPVILGMKKYFCKSVSFLEVHELTYCCGLCIIFYMYFLKNKTKKDYIKLFLLIAIFILGGKRIAFAGIIVSGIFSWIVHKKGMTKSLIRMVGIIGCIVCIIYVAILYNGDFVELLNTKGINLMGRDTLYRYFVNRTEFSVKYMGWGISGLAKAMENMEKSQIGNMINVRGIHNDILKIYINFGFLGAIIWFVFNLIYIPLRLFEKKDKRSATIYMCLSVYAFITYLTDNTENYFIFQVILMLLPLIEDKKKISEKDYIYDKK